MFPNEKIQQNSNNNSLKICIKTEAINQFSFPILNLTWKKKCLRAARRISKKKTNRDDLPYQIIKTY